MTPVIKCTIENETPVYESEDPFWIVHTDSIKVRHQALACIYRYFFARTLCLHYQGRNLENSPACVIIVRRQNVVCLVYVRAATSACVYARKRVLYVRGR